MNRPQSIDRCAYLGRVSTPRQKIEHQRESVLRFAEAEGIRLPQDFWFEDHVRRHKMLDEGKRFQELMKLVKAKKLDWILIATFDRWGIKDKDDVFVLRSELKKYDCKLWSVSDELDITGMDDASFWRVAARAEAATAYVSQQADKNIQKMILMAQQGWATTGNNPFAIDLVCYPIDRSRPLFRVVRMKYKNPHLYRILHYNQNGEVEREETSTSMPPRDKKATGYRYHHSIEADRIKAVKLMFDLFAEGMDEAQISEHLWKLKLGHYGKPFGYHGVQAILQNPAYIGFPMFGKNGVGQYKVVHDLQPKKVERKSSDPFVIKKPKEQWVGPAQPLDDLPPIIDPALFDKVQERFAEKERINPAFGKCRSRDRIAHPLNGRIICPDCNKPMVRGSSIAKHKKAKLFFVCGTYRRTIRTECNANCVSWDILDVATEEVLKTVKDRIEGVVTGNLNVEDDEWLRRSELGRVLTSILLDNMGGPKPLPGGGYAVPVLGRGFKRDDPKKGAMQPDEVERYFGEAFDQYDRDFTARTAPLRQELEIIEEELDALSTEIPLQRRKNPDFAERLDKRAGVLTDRKAEIEPQLVPLTTKARSIVEQLQGIKATIEGNERAKKASLLDTFVEAVYPIFDVKAVGKKKTRRVTILGFRFVPKADSKVITTEMKVLVARRVDPLFHLVASAFSVEVVFRQSTPEDRIRELRGQGHSLAEVARTTGTTESVVRRIVGKLDPSQEAQKRQDQEATAKRIEAEGGTWAEKVAKWQEATGTTGTTFWRVLKRCDTSS